MFMTTQSHLPDPHVPSGCGLEAGHCPDAAWGHFPPCAPSARHPHRLLLQSFFSHVIIIFCPEVFDDILLAETLFIHVAEMFSQLKGRGTKEETSIY